MLAGIDDAVLTQMLPAADFDFDAGGQPQDEHRDRNHEIVPEIDGRLARNQPHCRRNDAAEQQAAVNADVGKS